MDGRRGDGGRRDRHERPRLPRRTCRRHGRPRPRDRGRHRGRRDGPRAGATLLDRDVAGRFWLERHEIGERFARGEPGLIDALGAGANFDFIHVDLPPSRVLDLDRRAARAIDREGVHRLEHGLWVDDALYTLTIVDAAEGGPDLGRIARVREEVIAAAVASGGSIEAIHGIGTHLAPAFLRHAPGPARLFSIVKEALDPAGTLNPGKFGLDRLR